MRVIFFLIAFAMQWSAVAELPPIAVEFETRISNGKNKTAHSWSFERKGNQVTLRSDELTRRWTRLGDREIALENIYPPEKLVIEFAQGDLKSSGATADWNSLVHLIDTNLLNKLSVKGTRNVHGKEAVRYRGDFGNATWEILWIPAWGLPAMIRVEDEKGRMITQLKRVGVATTGNCDSTFTRIDFADIGDMESNEQLQRVLRRNPQLHHGHKH